MNHVQTIEKTGKVWKANMLIGGVVMVIGFVLFGWWAYERTSGVDAEWMKMAGIYTLALGALWYVASRIMAWWNHG